MTFELCSLWRKSLCSRQLRRSLTAFIAFALAFACFDAPASAQLVPSGHGKTLVNAKSGLVATPARRRRAKLWSNGTGQTGGLPAASPIAAPAVTGTPLAPPPGAGGPPPTGPASDAPAAAPRLRFFLTDPIRTDTGWIVIGRAFDVSTGRPARHHVVPFPIDGTPFGPGITDRRGIVIWRLDL